MTTATTIKSVREYAVETPGATRLFETLGIDYCCNGKLPLDEACRRAGLSPAEVMEQLEKPLARPVGEPDWSRAPLSALIEHIVATHHAFTRNEAQRIAKLLAKVRSVHGERHPELRTLESSFAKLERELTLHLFKEEQILFPYIAQLEAAEAGRSPLPHGCFPTVAAPISMMEFEHDNAGNALRELREIGGGYVPPADACISYRTLYQAMAEFESDLHRHIHLENNILHPRALELEGRVRADAGSLE